METLLNAYRDDDDEFGPISPDPNPISDPNPNSESTFNDCPPSESDLKLDPIAVESVALPSNAGPVSMPESLGSGGSEKGVGLGLDVSGKAGTLGSEEVLLTDPNCNNQSVVDDVREVTEAKKSELDEFIDGPPFKMQKSNHIDQLETATPMSTGVIISNGNGNVSKKSSKKKKSKNACVWTKSTSRKGKKRAKNFHSYSNVNSQTHPIPGDAVLLAPAPRFTDKSEDSHEAKICLSKVYKAEKVELSKDRLSASSCKGFRMARATRGVSEGAWFFEIKVVHLGETGHVRLGWSTDKGDLQAPVGYDGCSFGYRDVDGSKVHKALREEYGGEGYKEGDVIGFYISLPEGHLFAPKGLHLVSYKGQKYVCDSKKEPLKSVTGSEISFFKNGVCQGVAFRDLNGGIYYPAASMYTLPNQPNCVVKFNFGRDFECFPADFGGRPVPRPMIDVPYHGSDNLIENGVSEENK